jgi:hypothetical protein
LPLFSERRHGLGNVLAASLVHLEAQLIDPLLQDFEILLTPATRESRRFTISFQSLLSAVVGYSLLLLRGSFLLRR